MWWSLSPTWRLYSLTQLAILVNLTQSRVEQMEVCCFVYGAAFWGMGEYVRDQWFRYWETGWRQKALFIQEGESLIYPPPTLGRESNSSGTRSSFVEDGDWFSLSCLMAWQFLLDPLGRPRLAHEEVTIAHAQIAGLVWFRSARVCCPSGPWCLAKYHLTVMARLGGAGDMSVRDCLNELLIDVGGPSVPFIILHDFSQWWTVISQYNPNHSSFSSSLYPLNLYELLYFKPEENRPL